MSKKSLMTRESARLRRVARCSIDSAQFKLIVRNIIRELGLTGIRFKAEAIEALQIASEDYMAQK